MNERKKKKLKKLLKKYKEHLWDNINEENNNLLYQISLLDIEDMVDYLINELK